jgi:hypothetical protein
LPLSFSGLPCQAEVETHPPAERRRKNHPSNAPSTAPASGASQLDHGLVSASAGHALAAVLLEHGDPARAVDALVGTAGGAELPLIPSAWRTHFLELLTRCWLALGRLEEASRAAAAAETCAATFGLRLAAALADRAVAAVALESNDLATATQRALASAMAADEVGVPVEAALSRTLAGRALAQAGHHQQAATELARAAKALHACGALGYRDQAEQELRQLGHRVHRRTRPGKPTASASSCSPNANFRSHGWSSTARPTPRSRQACFSKKTIESHMHNMFHKLGVGSRVELARAIEHADRTKQALSQ